MLLHFAFIPGSACCYDVLPVCIANGDRVTTPALSLIKSDLPEKWQEILADLITDPKELIQILDLDPTARPYGNLALTEFPLKVPRPFAARMKKGNWDDPLLLQVWPDRVEEHEESGLSRDPLLESEFNQQPGLLQKYHGRALLTAAPHCAIHCRYCFRRHFDYKANTPGRARWQQALDYIAADSSIKEVILSGGDPLAAPDSYLDWLLGELDGIPHVDTIRIHTRLPVVIPQRVTADIRQALLTLRSQCVIVLHCNHANELDPHVFDAIDALHEDGHSLLNQSVLLKGVNDDSATLIHLNQTLFSHHVLPYYLHMPDQVSGTGHFHVGEVRAKQIMTELQAKLPGYLVPTLVREEPGRSNKTRLA
ncbi:MAG: EF-P beta-lysylation protein EpmB [Gammaproteobacteria bacterium]|nr:EF-P beta-lysylation protein EpmB [Gammaproteobacteria bacterium]